MTMGPDPSAQIAADAASAKKNGIIALVVGFCCCGPVGIVLGVMAMNKANGVLQMIAQTGMGQQYAGDANTGKTCGIIAIALGVLNVIALIVQGIMIAAQQ